MSISDPGSFDPRNKLDESTPSCLPGSVFDPAVLTRLANEFFTSLPASGNVPSLNPELSAASAENSGVATTAPTPPPVVTAVNKARTVPAQRYVLPEIGFQDKGNGDPGLPAVANIGVKYEWLSALAFSFLNEARPIFGEAMLTEARVEDLLSFSEGPTVPAKDAPESSSFRAYDPGAQQVPGAPAPPEGSERAVAYGFLNEVRQLLPSGATRIPEPPASQADVLPDLGLSSRSFEVSEIRRDFPILEEQVNGRPLIWLDNAATTQKPRVVIDRLNRFYLHENSNIHRAAHELAARATDAYEAAREKVRRFLNASTAREIIFVRGATEGINLVAQSWGRQNIRKDDEIVITWLEHHANIVPWQMLCAEKGARLRVAPVDDSGQILLDEYTRLIGPQTRLVSFAQVSNALGTVAPAKEMIEIAHRQGAKVLLDGAQAVSHIPVDMQLLDCDFYIFSGHKVFGPTGIGAVYGKLDILEHTQPWQGGGSMIQDVTFEKTVYNVPPARFEAGTGSIADAVGLGAAIDYLQRLGMANVSQYEHDLLIYATEALRTVPGLHIIGTAKEKTSVLSFVIDGLRSEDIGAALNRAGIAVRAGHHCAQPIHRRFGLESTVRASLAPYNTCDEIDGLVAALWNLKQGNRPII